MLVQMFWQILSTRTESNIFIKTWTLNIFNLSKHEPSTSSGWLYTCARSEWTLRNLRNSLDCDGHATLFPDCNPWFKETPTRSVGTIYLCSQRTTPNIGANVLANFPINCEKNIHQKIWTINIFIHVPFTTESHASRGFPSPNPPPRPRPYLSCREPEAEAAGQNPNGTKGRKNSEKILGTSKSQSVGKLWPLKILSGLS